MVETEIRAKNRSGKRWGWVFGSVIAVLVAVAVTSGSSRFRKISFFIDSRNSCSCSQDLQKYTGMVEGCCCDYETVDSLNKEVLHPFLQELVTTPFFRYFKEVVCCKCRYTY